MIDDDKARQVRGELVETGRGRATRLAEEVRGLINTTRVLQDIARIAQELDSGYVTAADPVTGQALEARPMDSTDVTRLRASADLRFKLLAKVLPDLKSVELTGPDGESLQLTGSGQPDRLVLATKLLALAREAEAAAPLDPFEVTP